MTTAQKIQIKKAVNAALREILSDPDYGLELRAGFKKKLKKTQAEIAQGRTSNLVDFLRGK